MSPMLQCPGISPCWKRKQQRWRKACRCVQAQRAARTLILLVFLRQWQCGWDMRPTAWRLYTRAARRVRVRGLARLCEWESTAAGWAFL